MLKRSKIVVGALVALLCAVPFATPVSAAEATASEPEIAITTDKVEYSGDDQIKETVTVQNVTDGTVTDVTITGNIPEGYVTQDGKEYPAQWTSNVSEVGAGETTEVTVVFSKKGTATTEAPSNTPDENKTTPATGDSHQLIIVLAIAAVCLVAAIVLIKNKKGRQALSALLVVVMAGSLCSVGTLRVNAAETEDEENSTLSYDGYNQVWADEFEGTELNRNDWNVELHDPGWVNAEWQSYVDSTDNIYLEDGNLVIKPIKTVAEDGTATYTSGRINTQNKHDFTYGIFEARVKVPEGMGYLPAFWLMATDENQYGQWPRCGEIDIMEVMGQSTDTAHGTIHYGNPHNQSQGTYKTAEGQPSFSDEFHTFAVEWEPGKISWYIDGQLYYTESDWHSTTEGLGTLTYPAPFDQPFYVILNLAVGGGLVGYPDETTDFENAAYEVDYVRVYQRDSYDENVTKPEEEVTLRDPDTDGNYVINGDFAVAEDLTDSTDWSFLLSGGQATAEITNNEMVINTTNAGTLDYSVQLVQPNLPMKKGGIYTVSFDAYADEARTMIVDISAPDNNWIRYLADTKVDLTTEKQTFTYEFHMTNDDDANGRLEFNLGNTSPIADVHISNVSVKQTGFEEIIESTDKTVLADGNHVYNGAFQEGDNRLGFWDIENNAGAEVSVTALADGRRLKVVVPEGTTAENPVVVSQSELALAEGGNYELSYDLAGTAGTSISVAVAGQEAVSVDVTEESKNVSSEFTPAEGTTDMNIVFTFDKPGTYYLDNVRIVEDSLIKNGSFSAGLAGYEPYVDSSASATYVVDSLNEDNAVDFTINNTGDQAWKIQLKQNNVELENGQWYRLSFDAKSSIDRKLMFAIQRNGSLHNDDWTPYSGEPIVDLTSEYQTYEVEFQMKEPTDLQSVLSISMGAVGNTQITQQHRICIDNINLEKIDEPVNVEVPTGENLFKNPNFETGTPVEKSVGASKEITVDGKTVTFKTTVSYYVHDYNMTDWEDSSYGGAHETIVDGNDIIYNVTDAGTLDSHIQLKQTGLPLEKGATYEVSFKATSTADREIAANVMSTSYTWYGGANVTLKKDVTQDVEFEFTMTEDDANAGFFLSMGKFGDATAASTITLSDFKLVKVSDAATDEVPEEPAEPEEPTEPEEEPKNPVLVPVGDNLLANGDFASGETAWSTYTHAAGGADATYDFTDGKAVVDVKNAGETDWNVQMKQTGLQLEEGTSYRVAFTVESTKARTVKLAIMGPNDAWIDGAEIQLEANTPKTVEFDFKMVGSEALVQVSMGKLGDTTPASVITLDDFSLMKLEAENLLSNGDFASGETAWSTYTHAAGGADATYDFTDGKAVVDVKNAGETDWNVQMKQTGIQLEEGKFYRVAFTVESTKARTVKLAIMGPNDAWIDGAEIQLEANTPKTVEFDFKMVGSEALVQVSMGKLGDTTPASVITLDDFSLVEVE